MESENKLDLNQIWTRLFVIAETRSYSEQAKIFTEQAVESLKKADEALKKADEARKRVEDFFTLADAVDFIETLLAQPSGIVDKLFRSSTEISIKISPEAAEEVIELLRSTEQFMQQKATEAAHKLSQLQKEILLKLLLETNGYKDVRWTPAKWFGATAPSERAAFSTSLKRLESRGLIKRQTVPKEEKPERTPLVRLTNLGYRVAKQLTRQDSTS